MHHIKYDWSQPCLGPAVTPTLVNLTNIYYSKFAKDHTMFVMEQSRYGSHPETHWKHETPLPGCDCITWVTHKQLTVVAAGNWTFWDIIMIWSQFWNLHFWGSGGNLNFWGSTSLTTEQVLPIIHIWYSVPQLREYKVWVFKSNYFWVKLKLFDRKHCGQDTLGLWSGFCMVSHL